MTRALICCSEGDYLTEYQMKASGADIRDIRSVRYADEAIMSIVPKDTVIDVAIVDLQFSHGRNPQNGLYVISQLQVRQPHCYVVCMVQSTKMLQQYDKEILGSGAQKIINLSAADWRIQLHRALWQRLVSTHAVA